MLTDQNATPFDFDAQTSSDGVTWQTVGTFTVPSGPSDETYLLSSSVSAQYFRFVGRVGDLPAGSFTPAFMEPLF